MVRILKVYGSFRLVIMVLVVKEYVRLLNLELDVVIVLVKECCLINYWGIILIVVVK